MSLSNTAIKNTKYKDKPYKLTDEKGLYLYVLSSGKYWRFDYRFMGKRKTISFGVYPDVSLADARDRRDAARKLLAQEPPIDPSDARKAMKASRESNTANSFEVVAREWIASHMKNKAASHRDKVIRRFELYLFPWLGSKPIADITAPQMLETVKRMADSISKCNKRKTR